MWFMVSLLEEGIVMERCDLRDDQSAGIEQHAPGRPARNSVLGNQLFVDAVIYKWLFFVQASPIRVGFCQGGPGVEA
jgi:hypothetical protein